jgi:hypothetical protein
MVRLVEFREWSLLQNVQIPPNGYAAIILGILSPLIFGVGLVPREIALKVSEIEATPPRCSLAQTATPKVVR